MNAGKHFKRLLVAGATVNAIAGAPAQAASCDNPNSPLNTRVGPVAETVLERPELYNRLVSGEAEAYYQMGRLLSERAQITSPSYYYVVDEAAKMFQAAAERGHVEAQYRLGLLYADGKGVEEDFDKAMDYFDQAARHGHPQAGQARQQLAHYMSSYQLHLGC